MIKTQNIHKYFNKKTAKELHVINDINLELPTQGLIVLLGPSGCGKTTLLNTLSGLDKLDEGTLEIAGTKFTNYNTARFDEVRNKAIGYVFQNFYLLPEETVYENIRLTLRLIGLRDESIIKNRVQESLDHVSMRKYEKRLCKDLSGGQQQRVAIARAIAKDPKIIFADEPTGNLDAKNTHAVMELIRSIANQKLVLLVTHERSLAHQYADRVIELSDGKVAKDYTQTPTGSQSMVDPSTIYLRELNKPTELSDGLTDLTFYTDSDTLPKLSLRLIEKNDTLYIEVKGKDKQKIKFLDDVKELTIINDYRPAAQDTVAFEKDIEFKTPINHETLAKKDATLPLIDTFKFGIKTLKKKTGFNKFLGLTYMFSAIIIAFASAIAAQVLLIDETDVLEHPKNTIIVYHDQFDTFEDYEALKNHDSLIDAHLFHERLNLRFNMPILYQTSSSQSFQAHGIPYDTLEERDVVYGRLPQNQEEIVMDIRIADQILAHPGFQSRGVRTYEDVLELNNVHDFYVGSRRVFEVVGIVNTGAPAYYVDRTFLGSFSTDEFYIREFFNEGELIIVEGRDIQSPTEVLLTSHNPANFDLIGTRQFARGQIYDIVGVYEHRVDDIVYRSVRPIRSYEGAELFTFYEGSLTNRARYFYPDNVNDFKTYLEELNLEYVYPYEITMRNARVDALQSSPGSLAFVVVSIGAIILSLYFIQRAALLNRIKPIGIYRSIGVKKRTVIKMVLTETFLRLSVYGIISFMITAYLLFTIQDIVGDLIDLFKVTPSALFTALIMLYIIALLTQLLPLSLLLRKTPAEINTTFD